MKKYFRKLQICFQASIILFLLSTKCYAANEFLITVPAATPLPTQVYNGGVVNAYYTVLNNTNVVRNNNYVEALQKNVTQVTNDTRYCGASFSLQPHASCILKLAVNGPTSPSQGCKKNYVLLVCLPGGKQCSGTTSPLNVTSLPGVINAALVGQYARKTAGNPFVNLVMSTKDEGANWSTVVSSANIGSGLPVDFLMSSTEKNGFIGVKCVASTGTCLAVGNYMSTLGAGTNFYPNISYSKNNGITWTSVVDRVNSSAYPPSLSPNANGNNLYLSVDCAGQVCIAAGQYMAGNSRLPMITVSQNGGQTWVGKVDSTTGNLPSNIVTNYTGNHHNQYTTTACSRNVCIAAGTYNAMHGVAFSYPFITVSQDGGSTWATTLSSVDAVTALPANFFPPSGSNYNLRLNRATCENDYCIVVGRYETSNASLIYPLLITSHDNGSTWTPVISSLSVGGALPRDLVPTTLASITNNRNDFYTVSCSGLICVVGGAYQTNEGITHYPLLLASSNKGVTWQSTLFSASVGTSALPADFTGGASAEFNKIVATTCSGQLCFASGQYQNSAQNVYPLLLMSQDAGNHWSVKIDSSSLGIGLPANLFSNSETNNIISSVNCSGNFCVASGQFYTAPGMNAPLIIVSQDGGRSWVAVVNPTNTPSAFPSDFLKGSIGNLLTGGGSALPSALLVDALHKQTQSPYDREAELKSLIR